jgi:GT2 family glycosyltransferase
VAGGAGCPKRAGPLSDSPERTLPAIGVIIPTYRRYAYLRDVLTDLAAQTIAPAEVVVVDQTEPRFREEHLFDSSMSSLPLQVVRIAERGTCVSRNTGLSLVKSPIVLLLDDDLRFGPDLIRDHLRVLTETGAAAVHGAVVSPAGDLAGHPVHNPNWDAGWSLMASPSVSYRTPCIGVASGNLSIKRDALMQVRGFDERFNSGAGDDFDLGLRLFRAGIFVVFDPAPVVTHLRAQSGGRRASQALRNRMRGLIRPEPAPEIFYLYQKHFPGWGARLQLWLHLGRVFSRTNLKHPWVFVVGPFRALRSWNLAKAMSRGGPRYMKDSSSDAA